MGHERGITAELVRDFERYLNRKYAAQLGKRPLTVYIVPVTRDRLISDLPKGLGDISAGNLTATEERLQLVDFYAPKDMKPVAEIVVTGPRSPTIATVDDLAGKAVHVRKASSYYESLEALNARFAKEGKPAMKLTLVPDALEDEDMMDMLGAGLLQIIVVDDWKAKGWIQVVPGLKAHETVVLRVGGHTGWAFRKDSPKLAAALDEYYQGWAKKQGLAARRQAQYLKRVKQIKDASGTAEWARFEQTVDLFEKYGQQYGFDPLMLAAQGFQESLLDQSARSHRGAVGVMQIMPATGAEMKVGDITLVEANIHAGAKYMDRLMTRYFADAKFSESNRTLFAFASYNAGPGNISKMRKEAQKRGLDQDRWFNHVEIVVAEKIGIETTTYVRNIYKYYAAYKLQADLADERRKAREQVQPGKH
jgi:membrane-bound lytic murein transglycosylase MltF